MHTLLLHWQLETWTFWDGIFVIAGEGICQPLQILSLQRCGCGAVFQSSWEANGQHYIIREIIRKLQKMLFVLMKENGAEDVWSYYVPLGPDWTIFEFAPRRGFCTSTSIHHFFAWDPSSSDFRFRNYVDLTAAKLLGLTLCSFCLALSSVLSLSKLPWHNAAKAFFCVSPPADGDCLQYLSVVLHPYGHECPDLWAVLDKQSILCHC